MIFGKKNKEGNIALNVSYIDGIKGYFKSQAVQLSLDNELIIKPRIGKSPVVHLNYDQINNVEIISEKDIIEKQKSVVGRAVVGELLLGPLGAIVGGMSGIGDKSKSETHYYLVINYISKDNTTEALSFEIVGASLHSSSFIKELKQRCNIDYNKGNLDMQL